MINTVWFDVASVSPAFPSRYTTSPLQSRLSSALWASEGEGSCPILPSHLGGAIAFQDPNPSPRFLAPVRAARSLAQKCIDCSLALVLSRQVPSLSSCLQVGSQLGEFRFNNKMTRWCLDIASASPVTDTFAES